VRGVAAILPKCFDIPAISSSAIPRTAAITSAKAEGRPRNRVRWQCCHHAQPKAINIGDKSPSPPSRGENEGPESGAAHSPDAAHRRVSPAGRSTPVLLRVRLCHGERDRRTGKEPGRYSENGLAQAGRRGARP
jgi:hypothetical protein